MRYTRRKDNIHIPIQKGQPHNTQKIHKSSHIHQPPPIPNFQHTTLAHSESTRAHPEDNITSPPPEAKYTNHHSRVFEGTRVVPYIPFLRTIPHTRSMRVLLFPSLTNPHLPPTSHTQYTPPNTPTRQKKSQRRRHKKGCARIGS